MYYLYNGVKLPALPEYDTAAYPYAVLDKTNAGTSFLFYAFKSRPYYGTNPADSTKMGVYSTGGAKVYYFVPADGGSEWEHSMDTDNPFAAEDGNENTLFWTNTDILYEGDGSVWLAASEPVGEGNWRKNFLLGLALGLTGKPLRFAQGEPVAYLYNGVRLPPLPMVDKEKFPFAVITRGTGLYSRTEVCFVKAISYRTCVNSSGYSQYQVGYFGEYLYARKPSDSDQWGELKSATTENGLFWCEVGSDYIIWTNTDIHYESGEVAYAASDPVPVYE